MQQLGPDGRIGAYRIVRELGRGGVGIVYEAVHTHLGTRCALKVFSTESRQSEFLRKRFLAEGKVLARLSHPRIVHVSDLGVDEETLTPYFAMDLVLSQNGRPQTLEDARQEGVDEKTVAAWFEDLCEGLDYIHSEGIVHRDIKLENILVGPDGRAVISDFGISRIFNENMRRRIELTSLTMVDLGAAAFKMGTGVYMAPELKTTEPIGEATPASDAYALGVLLFRLLTGVWYEPQTKLLDMLSAYEKPWEKVVARLCDEDPAERVPESGLASLFMLLAAKNSRRRRSAFRKIIVVSVIVGMCAMLWIFAGRNAVSARSSAITPSTNEMTQVINDARAQLVNIKKDALSLSSTFRAQIEKELFSCYFVTDKCASLLDNTCQGLSKYLKPPESQELLDARAFAKGIAAEKAVEQELPECPTLASRATLLEINNIWEKFYSWQARTVRVDKMTSDIVKTVDAAVSCVDGQEHTMAIMNLAVSTATSKLAEIRNLMKMPNDVNVFEMRYPWTGFPVMCDLARRHIQSRFLPPQKAFKARTFKDGMFLTRYVGNADRFDVPSIIDGKRVLKICGGDPTGRSKGFIDSILRLEMIRNKDEINRKYGGVWKSSFDAHMQVALHDGLRIIGRNAFYKAGLMCATLPNGLIAIGKEAFMGCSELQLVSIPASLKYIGERAFQGDECLSFISFKGDAPYVHRDAFNDVSTNCIVYVSRNSKGWNVPIPGTWNGLRIEYSEDASQKVDVVASLDGSGDLEYVPTDGLVAYYPFDGDVNDVSGNGNHGQNFGTTLTCDRYGNPNRARYFANQITNGNASYAYVEVPDSVSLNSASNAVTVAAWIRHDIRTKDGGESWVSVLCKGYTRRQYSLQIDVSAQRIWLLKDEKSRIDGIRQATDCPKHGEWYHVAMTYDGENMKAYLDGELVGSMKSYGKLEETGEPLYIGFDPVGDEEFFCGAIDDVRIYNRALSEYEICLLFVADALEGNCIYTNSYSVGGASQPLHSLVSGNQCESLQRACSAETNETSQVRNDEVVVPQSERCLYCVIDLSGGPNATAYPVSYLSDVPARGWTDEYKTTKLVLRRIEPGSFKMCGTKDVTLTKPYYIGVFEVTQRQYLLVTGKNPSAYFAAYFGYARPVERVTYNMIRGKSNGSKWPSSPDVDEGTFMWMIRAKTGLKLDLPTEAQWEYACRAGTTSKYNNGGDMHDDLKVLGRCPKNQYDDKGGYSPQHTTVGSYLPNAWGLYDMHGNVAEWCLDWRGELKDGVVDPVGPEFGTNRIFRGGNYCQLAQCASGFRDSNGPNTYSAHKGFRLACPVDGEGK